jgi:hypothetical protein
MKEPKMKKITILLAILVLALMAAPAWANSVLNWNFETYSNGTYLDAGWKNGYDSDYKFTTGTYDSGNHFAQATDECKFDVIYQIVDVSKLSNGSQNPNWLTGGTSENYTLSFDYSRPDSSVAKFALYYWNSTLAVPTSVSNPNNPDSHWAQVIGFTTLPKTTDDLLPPIYPYTTSGTIDGSQPQYFLVILEGEAGCYPGFDNVDLSTVCPPTGIIPVPPSALLLGSGLLGLAGLGWRKRRAG